MNWTVEVPYHEFRDARTKWENDYLEWQKGDRSDPPPRRPVRGPKPTTLFKPPKLPELTHEVSADEYDAAVHQFYAELTTWKSGPMDTPPPSKPVKRSSGRVGRPQLGDEKRLAVTITLEPGVIKAIDQLREDQTRSQCVNELLKSTLGVLVES